MASTKSQNLSIMLTDIQGYSSASASSSREEILSLIHRHNQLMLPVIRFYNGTVVKTIGDALLVTFTSATDAAVCAIIIQLILREYNAKQADESHKLNLRVVINTGDVSIDRNDIFGDAVNITARMEALDCFPGNTIGISEATYLLMNRNEIVAEKIGEKELKGIPYPVVVYHIPLDQQKLTSIPTKLLELVERSVNASNDSAMDITEWSAAVTSFLREKNLGKQIGKNVIKHAGAVHRSLHETFTQATVLGHKSSAEWKDASPVIRFKSFAIDVGVLLAGLLVLNILWDWIIHPLFFGGNGGIFAHLVSFNLNYPIILCFIYFTAFWFWKGASPGQIATRTAVVMENGSQMDFATAAKRSALFVISSMMLCGIPALGIFLDMKKTLYDYLCKTRVVE